MKIQRLRYQSCALIWSLVCCALCLASGPLTLASGSDAEAFLVYSDAGIPAPPAALFTWYEANCSPSYDATYADNSAPEGQQSFRAAGGSCAWMGWGVFTNMNMSGYAGGEIRFFLKSTATLRFELEGPRTQKAGITVPSTGGKWQECVYAVADFAKQVDLSRMYGLFLLTATDGHTTFYVDNVRWLKKVTAPGSLLVKTNGMCTSMSDEVASLRVGESYVLTALKYPGYAFKNWTDGSGKVLAKTAKITFMMPSALVLMANYESSVKPTLVITAPKQGQRLADPFLTMKGVAKGGPCLSSVRYQVNSGPWQSAAGVAAWTANINLAPGLNTIRAYAAEGSGGVSPTNTIKCYYVLAAPVNVHVEGQGTVSPNYIGKLLEIGKTYNITAAPSAGYAFVNWTGSATGTKRSLTFVAASNLTFTAHFVDIQKPFEITTSPKGKQKVSSAVFTVTGKAGDNAGLAGVFCQVNGNPWVAASSTDGFTNWTAQIALAPGLNTVRAYALDTSGNKSRTNSVTFSCDLQGTLKPLKLKINGNGTVNPNYDRQSLFIGETYTVTATPGAGFRFADWTDGAETRNPVLSFTMVSDLTLSANFVGAQIPSLHIKLPAGGQRFTNSIITVTGTSNDDTEIAKVFLQVNNNQWAGALTTNQWAEWSAAVSLTPGTNVIRAYALDNGGNRSATNSATVFHVVTAPVLVEVKGRGVVSPNYDGQRLEIGRAYTMTAVPVHRHRFTEWTGGIAGNDPTLTFIAASNLTITACFEPAGRMLSGIDFSPYEEGQSPDSGTQISLEQLRQRMNLMTPYSDWIRTYGCTLGLENAGQVGREFQFKTAIGAWLSSNSSANETEISNLIQAGKQGYVDLAIVGSETQLRGDLSEDQLLEYLARVKRELPGIPVTTADGYLQWVSHRRLFAAVDVVMVNYYPFWEGAALSNAIPTLDGWHRRLESLAGGKPVVVSETGWPSAGNTVGNAVPSAENASYYFLNFVSWALSNQVAYFYFAAFDESWKSVHEGALGAHWGIWDANGAMKTGMQRVFDGESVPDNWSGRAVPGGPGTPTINFVSVPTYGTADNLAGQVLHVPWADYAVAVYIYVSGWWSKPTYANPLTPIQIDGRWTCDVTTGGFDQNATAFAAYVLPLDYSPPLLGGAGSIPADLENHAVASVYVTRSP